MALAFGAPERFPSPFPSTRFGAHRTLMPRARGTPDDPLLSVVMPVFNEGATIDEIIRRVLAVPLRTQLIVVDDCSTDGTRDTLTRLQGELGFTLLLQPKNRGKGAALRAGFEAVRGDLVVIQDADLEYDPQDWALMYDLIALRKVADVVYGSRFHGRAHRSLYFHHYLANRLISLLFNALYNQTLSDIETCYKMMTVGVARSLRLSADDFGAEVEISANIARQRKLRIYELGITYYGRSYDEGKKINWKDGVKALWYLLKFRFA